MHKNRVNRLYIFSAFGLTPGRLKDGLRKQDIETTPGSRKQNMSPLISIEQSAGWENVERAYLAISV